MVFAGFNDSRLLTFAGVWCIAALMGTEAALAQTQSLFGNRGPLSQTGTGTSTFGRSATTGTGGLTTSGLGTGGLGTGGLGTSALSQGPQLNTQMGALSATVGQGTFVGRSDNTGRFVGNRLAGQQTTQTGGGQGASFAGTQGGFRSGQGFAFSSANQLSGQGNGFGAQPQAVPLRPQVRVGFEFTRLEPAKVQTSLQKRFAATSASSLGARRGAELSRVGIDLEADGTVVLHGTVASEHQRRLAESLARMEPGVRSVRNELVVELPPAE